MKTILSVVFSLVSFFSFAQHEKIVGDGNLKNEVRSISAFTGVVVSGNVNVDLTYGEPKNISIEADQNILPYIETLVENGNLVVRTKDKVEVRSKNKILVHASLTTITRLAVSGSGSILGAGNFSNDGKTDISVSGSGNIDVAMNSFNQTKVNVSGSGNVTLKGKSTNNINATISGSGNINCADVSCDDVLARVSGSGNIKVFANKSIEAKVSGSGNIYYRGSATNINIKSSGSGKIIKV